MAKGWFGSSREASLAELIVQKKYTKAIELLRAQFQEGGSDPRQRMQLADVLVAAGRQREAVPVYVGIADDYAREGFTAKAIAVYKRVQKLDPERRDIEKRLAHLAREKQGASLPLIMPPGGEDEIGLSEIGFEPRAIPAPEAEITPAPPPVEVPIELPHVADIAPAPPAAEASIELLPPAAEPATAANAGEEELFFDSLLATLEAPPSASRSRASTDPSRRVVSPLFDDFAEDELVALMERLDLVFFEPGDIIISEGEAGDSLFVLTTGVLKAFVRNPAGRQVFVRELAEGSFFGEISILSGRPRTATITCATHAELLVLDRRALDAITVQHPRVQQVLLDFYKQRHGSDAEQLVRGMGTGATSRVQKT
jgi:CRP-like cAMP-binding protein